MPTSRRNVLLSSFWLAACSAQTSSPQPSTQAPPTRALATHAVVLQGAGSCEGPMCTMHFAAEARGDTATFSSAARRGRLTDASQAKARELGAKLAALDLEPRYGCPGCADGPTYVAIVHHADGTQTHHAFDPMQLEELPTPLRDAAELIDAVDSALQRCESTSLVQVGPECARAGDDAPTGRP